MPRPLKPTPEDATDGPKKPKSGSLRKISSFDPKNEAQARLKEAIATHPIVLAIGPAGGGKSHAAMALAVALFRSHFIHRIIMCRPAVGSEDLGYFPGTEAEKIDPYHRNLFQILGKIGGETIANGNMIEPVSFATMRGATYDDACVIVDEAQNATFGQLEMALTRLGVGSKMIVTGDPSQSDLPEGKSGLLRLIELLKDEEEIPTVYFEADCDLRHPIVSKLTKIFERYRKNNQ